MNRLYYGDNLDVLRRHVADESYGDHRPVSAPFRFRCRARTGAKVPHSYHVPVSPPETVLLLAHYTPDDDGRERS